MKEMCSIIVAQATIEGNLYRGVSGTSDQPRVGSDDCVSCAVGTWPKPDGQR